MSESFCHWLCIVCDFNESRISSALRSNACKPEVVEIMKQTGYRYFCQSAFDVAAKIVINKVKNEKVSLQN